MRKLLKWIAAALAAALLCAVFVGCGNYRGQSGDDSGDETKYEIDFNLPVGTSEKISVIIPDNEYERTLMKALIKGFNSVYPNIEVAVNTLTIDSYNTTISRQYNAGVLADIVWCNSQNFYFLVGGGYALNLNGFVEQAEIAGEFDYDKDFTEDFRNMGVLKDVRYSVPRSVDSVVCFYNKEILTQANVDMSEIKNGWTWETFLKVCEQVRSYYDEKGNKTYFPVDANLGWEAVSYPVIRSLNGDVLDKDGKFSLTEEVSDNVVSFVQDLVKEGYIPKGSEQTSSFESGTGAFLFQSTSIENYQSRATLKDKFDIVSFPLIAGENSAIGMGYAGYALNSSLDDDGKDPAKLNAAAAFLNYIMSFEGQQIAAGEGGLTLPSIRTDLSASNPDANWHKKFSGAFNVEAYTWGSQYKMREEFLDSVDSIFANDLISAMNTYVGSYAIRDPQNAYDLFKREVEYVFDSVVT